MGLRANGDRGVMEVIGDVSRLESREIMENRADNNV